MYVYTYFLFSKMSFMSFMIKTQQIKTHQNQKFSVVLNSDDIGSCHIETTPLICRANQWTDFYMIGTFVMEELKSGNVGKNN